MNRLEREILAEVDGVRLVVMDSSDIDDAAPVLANIICSTLTEAMAGAVGIPEAEFCEFYRVHMRTSVEDGFTLLGVDSTTGEILAVFYNHAFAMETPPPNEALQAVVDESPKLQVFVAAVAEIDEILREACRSRGFSKAVLIHWSSASAAARGKGLTKLMVGKVSELANAQGYDSYTVFITNYFSQRIGKRLGFEAVKVFQYADWEVLGQVPYANCNQVALEWLKENGVYKESFGEEIATHVDVCVRRLMV